MTVANYMRSELHEDVELHEESMKDCYDCGVSYQRILSWDQEIPKCFY